MNIRTEVKGKLHKYFHQLRRAAAALVHVLERDDGKLLAVRGHPPTHQEVIAKRISRRSTGFVAKALGITIPQALLAAADAIIDKDCLTSVDGPFETSRYVRSWTAIGMKADVAPTSHFGGD